MRWHVEPYEGVDEDVQAPCELGWLGIREGVEPIVGEVRVSPFRGESGGGKS